MELLPRLQLYTKSDCYVWHDGLKTIRPSMTMPQDKVIVLKSPWAYNFNHVSN